MTDQATMAYPAGGKAQRVYLSLKDEIAAGVWADGANLPGEHRLAEDFGVSRVTIRRALDALAAEGLVERQAGSGTRVRRARPRPALAADLATLMPQIVEMGQRTTVRLLSFSYRAVPAPVAAALALREGTRVQNAVRLRFLDGEPFSHLTTHVPEEIAASYSEADLATTPLFRLLERSGIRLKEARQSVSATLASPDVAEALGVAVGSPLLSLTRVMRDHDGRGVEHLAALYRPDLFRLDMTLARVGDGGDRHWAAVLGREDAA